MGIRYYNDDSQSFVWKSTNNGKMNTPFWSKDEHQYKSYDKKIYYDDKMLKENCFSHNKLNRKISFYYKLPEYIKEDYDEYSNALINLYKMNNSIYGFTKKINSNIVWFDLDNHNISEQNEATIKLKRLLEILEIKEKDLLYIEGNYFTGGIHCAIRMPYQVDEKFYQELEKRLKDNGLDIECNFTNKILRLPCSFEYLPLIKGEIADKNYFEEKDYEPSVKKMIEKLSEKSITSNYLNRIYEELYNKLSKDKLSALRKHLKLVKDKKWLNYWKNSRDLFEKESDNKIISDSKELYKITNGNRWNIQRVLIPYMYIRGYTLEQVLDKILELNVDSKDYKNGLSQKHIKEITNFYNKCKDKFKIIPRGIYQKYISNQNKLSEITLQFFENEDFKRYLTEKFIKNYIKVRNYKNNYISKEKYDILILQIPYLIKEIIGKMYYHIDHKKTFKKESMMPYNGFQLSYKELELLQEQSIKDLLLDDSNPLCKTSIQYLKKALLMTLDIEEIHLYKHNRNWINGSCKAFRINSLNDINEVLRHLYNSCFKDIVNKNFILNSNNIYILYISLIENYEIINVDEIDFINLHIPINLNSS